MTGIDLHDKDKAASAAEVLNRLGVPVSPPISLCPRDMKLATVPELMAEIQRRSVGVLLVSVATEHGGTGEEWTVNIQGSNALLCGMCDRVDDELTAIRKARKRGFE